MKPPGKGILGLLLGLLTAQRYQSDSLTIRFYSEAPLEKITAINSTGCQSWIDFSSDSVFVQVKIRAFSFPNKLMQEHFNENYLESERYPYAYFRGKLVTPFPYTTPGTYAVSAQGSLEIHGVAHQRVVTGTFEVQPDGRLRLEGKCWVRPADHKIKVPRFLWQKIAEVIEVTYYGFYSPLSAK
ncbi:MAG: YceI family protein [Bacteroidia bacterium]